MDDTRVDTRRVLVFLAFAFGLAWLAGLVVYLTGGLAASPALIPGLPGLTLATALIAVAYMGAPAVAHVLTRALTREGWQGTLLHPRLRQGWPYWVAAWVAPALFTIAGAALTFALFPRYFDPSLSALRAQFAAMGQTAPDNLWPLVALQTLSALAIAPVINSLFTFGEEFGWRGYLLPRLLPMGTTRALLLIGVIWGVWHWPVILMGHNYGLNYPGAPWLGPLAMVWFTFVTGTFLAWVTIKGGSVWPAVIGHAAINGIAAIGVLFSSAEANPVIGPMATGVVAALPWALFALWVLWRRPRPAPATAAAADPAPEPAAV